MIEYEYKAVPLGMQGVLVQVPLPSVSSHV